MQPPVALVHCSYMWVTRLLSLLFELLSGSPFISPSMALSPSPCAIDSWMFDGTMTQTLQGTCCLQLSRLLVLIVIC